MAYVDAYVLPCPQDKVAAYRRLARKAGAVWKDHGALQYMECVADDVEPGKSTSFPRAVKAKFHFCAILFHRERSLGGLHQIFFDCTFPDPIRLFK